MLSQQDVQDVLKVGQTVMECGRTDEMRAVTLRLLEQVFKCDSGNFFLVRRQGAGLDFNSVVTRNITPQNLARFKKYYYRLDPFMKHFPPSRAVLTMDHVAPPRKLMASEYYADFLNPQAIRHQITITARAGGGAMGVVALFRPKNRDNFGRTDQAKAELIAPYLAGALSRSLLADQNQRQKQILQALAAARPETDLLVLDADLNLLFCSQPLARLLPIPIQDCLDVPAGPRLPGPLTEASRRLLDGEPEKTISVETPGGREQPIILKLRRLEPESGAPLVLAVFESRNPGPAGAANWPNWASAPGNCK